MFLPYLRKAGVIPDPTPTEVSAKLKQIVQAAGDRIKVAGDILDYAHFFRADDQLAYDEQAFEKRIRKPPEAVGLLTKFRSRLAAAEPFDAANLEKLMQDYVQAEGVNIGQIIHALRVAVTGKAVGFGLFDSLAILGKEHCLARIDRALSHV
jgi:glutamyl-tRNA synthetase